MGGTTGGVIAVKGYTFNIGKDSASFSFINDTEEKRDILDKHWSHYGILHRLLNFLRSRGWCVMNDDSVHKIIRKGYFCGKKRDLEFELRRYPVGFSFEFYQNIVFENPNGGRYDFGRFEKMPYTVRLMFLNETRHMKEFLENLGCIDNSKPIYGLAEDKIKLDFVECWHHPQKSMDFKLSDLDGETCEGDYNHTDRDKKIILNGQVKYFRHWDGRLRRGRVYHNINNMWWVILDRFKYTNIADFQLFDPTPDDFKNRRLKEDKKPKSYLDKKEKLQQSSNRELINELKRRGLNISA